MNMWVLWISLIWVALSSAAGAIVLFRWGSPDPSNRILHCIWVWPFVFIVFVLDLIFELDKVKEFTGRKE